MRKTPGLLANTWSSSVSGPPSSYKEQGGTAGKPHSRMSRAGAPKADRDASIQQLPAACGEGGFIYI